MTECLLATQRDPVLCSMEQTKLFWEMFHSVVCHITFQSVLERTLLGLLSEANIVFQECVFP
jgi:hypothetical protein